MTFGQQSIFDLFPGTVATIPAIEIAVSRLPPRASEASTLIRQWVTEGSTTMPIGFQPGLHLRDDAGREGTIRAMTRRPVDGHDAITVLLEGDDNFRRYDLIQGIRLHPTLGLITPAGRHLLADLPGIAPIPGDCVGEPCWPSEDAEDVAAEPIHIGTTVHLGNRWNGTVPATVVGYRGIWLAITCGDEPIQVQPVYHVNQFPYAGQQELATRGMQDADQEACAKAVAHQEALRARYASALCQRVEQELRAPVDLDLTHWRALFAHVRTLRECGQWDKGAVHILSRLVKHLSWVHRLPNGTVLEVGPSQQEDREYLQARITVPDLRLDASWCRWISVGEALKGGAWSAGHQTYLETLTETCVRAAHKEIEQATKEHAKTEAAKRKACISRASLLADALRAQGGVPLPPECEALISRLCIPVKTKATTAELEALVAEAATALSRLVHPRAVELSARVIAAILQFEVPSDAQVQELEALRDCLLPDSGQDRIYAATNAAAMIQAIWGFSGCIKEFSPGEWGYVQSGSCGWDCHGAISETGYRSVSNLSEDQSGGCDAALEKLHRELVSSKAKRPAHDRSRDDGLCADLTPSQAAVILNRHAGLPETHRRLAIIQDVEDLRIANGISLLHAGLALIGTETGSATPDDLSTWMERWNSQRRALHRHHEHIIHGALEHLAEVVRHHLEQALLAHLPGGYHLITYRTWGDDRTTLTLGTEHTLIDIDGRCYRFPASGLRLNHLAKAIEEAMSPPPVDNHGQGEQPAAYLEGEHQDDPTGEMGEDEHDGEALDDEDE